jgi:hypothetical protein
MAEEGSIHTEHGSSKKQDIEEAEKKETEKKDDHESE